MKLIMLLIDSSMLVVWLIALYHWLDKPQEENQEQEDETNGLF